MLKCRQAKISLMNNLCKLNKKLFIIVMKQMWTLSGILRKLTMHRKKIEEQDIVRIVSKLLFKVKKPSRT